MKYFMYQGFLQLVIQVNTLFRYLDQLTCGIYFLYLARSNLPKYDLESPK